MEHINTVYTGSIMFKKLLQRCLVLLRSDKFWLNISTSIFWSPFRFSEHPCWNIKWNSNGSSLSEPNSPEEVCWTCCYCRTTISCYDSTPGIDVIPNGDYWDIGGSRLTSPSPIVYVILSMRMILRTMEKDQSVCCPLVSEKSPIDFQTLSPVIMKKQGLSIPPMFLYSIQTGNSR